MKEGYARRETGVKYTQKQLPNNIQLQNAEYYFSNSESSLFPTSLFKYFNASSYEI